MKQQQQPSYDAVIAPLRRRLAALNEEDNEAPPQRLAEELARLCRECNRLAPGAAKLEEKLVSLGDCRRRIRQLLDRVGELERARFELPLPLAEKKEFASELTTLRGAWPKRWWRGRDTYEALADMRYLGSWGLLGGESEKRSRRLIEVNRYLTDRPSTRDRGYARAAIIVALIMGLLATAAAVLAIPPERTDWLRCATPVVAPMLCAEASANAADVLD